jgi:predicted ArsR family transcriptional regulator
VLDHSYQALPADLAATFRCLSLLPVDDITAGATAALLGSPATVARRHLDRLVDEHLVMMSGPDRYRLHVLLRDYAREQAERQDLHARSRLARC